MYKQFYDFFVAINEINKHKAKIYNHCTYTLIIIKKLNNYIKKIFTPTNIKKISCLVNIRMINLSFDELRLIAQARNISDYENKSKEDLIKALSGKKPETPKLETPYLKTTKSQTPKSEKLNPKTPKPKIRVNKKKLEKT